ncbi:hypothetical protein EVAR_37616_1 [Eumeta japonica]|uniref:Uncharacterized protein n=1 Tax=Eumeta variegata TaxID=151549 RepID=A0A4C1VQX6_EUMVA|nr:hypothetical protein EVAR_37616_1 [Eumeta japonica]
MNQSSELQVNDSRGAIPSKWSRDLKFVQHWRSASTVSGAAGPSDEWKLCPESGVPNHRYAFTRQPAPSRAGATLLTASALVPDR